MFALSANSWGQSNRKLGHTPSTLNSWSPSPWPLIAGGLDRLGSSAATTNEQPRRPVVLRCKAEGSRDRRIAYIRQNQQNHEASNANSRKHKLDFTSTTTTVTWPDVPGFLPMFPSSLLPHFSRSQLLHAALSTSE